MNATSNTSKYDWVNLATFDHLSKAKYLQGFLEQEKFETHIQNERGWQRFWFLVRPRAGIHLQVRPRDLERAQASINKQPTARGVFDAALKCPQCSSGRIQYPAMTRKNILPTLVAHVLVLLRVTDHEFYCEDCHHTWKRFSSSRRVGRKVAKVGS